MGKPLANKRHWHYYGSGFFLHGKPKVREAARERVLPAKRKKATSKLQLDSNLMTGKSTLQRQILSILSPTYFTLH